jgi:hypothetical protein
MTSPTDPVAEYKVGDRVYYQGYLAEIVSIASPSRFKHIPRYLIEPYAEQMPREVVKETKLLKAYV